MSTTIIFLPFLILFRNFLVTIEKKFVHSKNKVSVSFNYFNCSWTQFICIRTSPVHQLHPKRLLVTFSSFLQKKNLSRHTVFSNSEATASWSSINIVFLQETDFLFTFVFITRAFWVNIQRARNTRKSCGVNKETSFHVIGEYESLKGLRETCLGKKLLSLDNLSFIPFDVLLNFIGRIGVLEGWGQLERPIGLLVRSVLVRSTLESLTTGSGSIFNFRIIRNW